MLQAWTHRRDASVTRWPRSFAADHVAQRELRDVVRYRKRLIEDRAREANRLQKVLETANIKLASAPARSSGSRRAP
jgi:hypothetical protein